MSESLKRLFPNRYLPVHLIVSIILVSIICYFNWIVGLSMALIVILSFVISIQRGRTLQRELDLYIANLSHRVKQVGEEALLEMPIGIVLYNADHKIEWANPYMHTFWDEEVLIGKSLDVLSNQLIPAVKDRREELWFSLEGNQLQAEMKHEEHLIYVFDRTAEIELQTLYENDQTVIAIIYLDNYEEITQNMEDTLKSQLNSKVTASLNEWALQYGLYLKRTSQDRFIAVGTQEVLAQLEKMRFNILDYVRDLDAEQEQKNPVTLSIGVGVGKVPLPLLGELAQSSLDLALGRGGDQVAIKDDVGKVRFYGGKTNPMEKRTRVRARVISHALRDLVKQSDKVMIMGHQSPDMDSIGAAIGILNIAECNGIDGYIVFDPDDVNPGMNRIMETIKDEESLWRHFIHPDEAEGITTNRSLVVVVDTHKPSMLPNERLLHKTDYKVVIDHHRRGEEFVDNPTLVYMEPYASSTAELVTELLEYQPKTVKLTMVEATALLAGIIVDTKSFTLRTGSRTFDAASYLRSNGADTVLVQKFMKEDIDVYVKRSKLIEQTEIYKDRIAIARGEEDLTYDHVLIAQAADTLLTMSGVQAAFVISKREDGRIGISARSLGDVNVQIIMEEMGGGGHLTNAATQIGDTTIEETIEQLKQILVNYTEGGEES